MSFDLLLFQTLHNLADKNKLFDKLIIFLAHYLPYILAILAVILLFVKVKETTKRLYILSVFTLSAIISRGLITEIIRFFHYRLRPFMALHFTPLVNHDLSGAFPSGHMTFYFVLALSFFLLSRKWGWFAVISVTLTGLARIIAGVHWPSDILGGILIAIISYFLVKKLLPDKLKTASI